MGERRGRGGTCIKDPWERQWGRGQIECGRWGVGRAGESNGGRMGITVVE